MDARDREMAEALLIELRAAPPIMVELDAYNAYKLVGLLQLAIRHPLVNQRMPWAAEMVHAMVDVFSAIGPVTARTMQMGFDPAFDDSGN